MLSLPHTRSRGLTLVELIVVMAIIAMVMMMAAPSFSVWITNSRIRTTADSVMAGLQAAKTEAVSRNARVRFQLTSSLDNGCVVSTNAANWVISLDPNANATEVEGQCATAPSESPAASPFILQTRPAAAGSGTTSVVATAGTVVFNGVGRLAAPLPLAGNVTIDFSNPAGGACAAAGGELNCLRIVITSVGQVRMCNPDPGLPAGDPRIC
jgi:type IV fimbrial biogenesis protein FimT